MRASRLGAASGLAAAVLLTVAPDLPHRRDREPAPRVAPATVAIYGRAGTFGAAGEQDTTPSGQDAAVHAVPGWDFAPGVQAYRTALAADGTVFVAGLGHDLNFKFASADRTVVAAYQPRANAFSTVQIGPARQGAPSVTDLEPVNRGMAYLTRSLPGAGAFGVLTKVDGRWQATELTQLGGGPNDMATLPRSRDIIVAQYRYGLTALRVTGPDPGGRFTVTVKGRYAYPGTAVREVHTDPTGRAGDERFTVGLDGDGGRGLTVQELSYDAATGKIRPVSARITPGDRTEDGKVAYGYGTFMYDHAGNLWVSRVNIFHGGKLAIYTAQGGRRKLSDGPCRYDAERRTDRPTACRPDYDILQPKDLLGLQGIAQDPVTKDIVALSFGGTLVPIRATGTGTGMSFRVGNLVDLGRKLLPAAGKSFADHRMGPVDSTHRVWLSAMQGRAEQPGTRLDQWLYSVDIAELFDPDPVRVPDTPGRSVAIQAERTRTITATRRPGTWATVDVDSDAYVQPCPDWPASTACGYDGVAGNGFVLGDDSGYGHLYGTVEYRIEVPTAGNYRVRFRVGTFKVIKDARIALSVAGRTYTVPVVTGGSWREVQAEQTIALPAGVHTVRLSAPDGANGWALNWWSLQRA